MLIIGNVAQAAAGRSPLSLVRMGCSEP